MKLTKHQIKVLSDEVVAEITGRRIARISISDAEAAGLVEHAVTEDLMVEDRLNDEVKDILTGFQREIEQGKVDYKTMFDMVKKKLARERGLVL